MQVQEMIAAHPNAKGRPNARLTDCIEQCYNCAQTCTSCADASLAEPDILELKQVIRLCLDCADICTPTGSMASRRTGSNVVTLRAVIEACEMACRVSADECEKHAHHHEHCRICADACLRCADACTAALAEVH